MSEHAKFSPSHSETWAYCTKAPELEATMPEQASSPAAEEGTIAHSVLETCLSYGIRPEEVAECQDDEMAEAVQLTLDYVMRRQEESPCKIFIEQRVEIHPDIWGTADIILVGDAWLEVIDFKYVRSYLVEVENHPQLQIYALGAWKRLMGTCFTFRTTIVQPRIPHPDGLIRSWDYSSEELHDRHNFFCGAVKAIYKGITQYSPRESTCRWCRAKPVCPALREKALQDAQVWFADAEPAPTAMTIEQHAIKAPDQLTMEQRVVVLQNVELIRAWLKAVEAHALEIAKAGTVIPGFKVVEGTGGQRKWELEAEEMLKKFTNLKIRKADITKQTLLGPAPIEKLLKKLVKQEKITEKAATRLMGYCIKPKGKLTLVPETDRRPSIREDARQMFADV